MKKKFLKKMLAVTAAAAMAVSMAACGSEGDEGGSDSGAQVPTIDQIKLGEDYTDITASLRFLTHKTDIVDTTFQKYIAKFQEMYPNISIEYEGITDYANDITTRLTTGDWGDICMIPPAVDKDELSNYFTKLGSKKTLSESYEENLLNNFSYGDDVYGVPSMANVQGVIYNRAVFKEAGIEELPKTPDQFIEALKKIKENTDAIPLYTNFGAGSWTMAAWDAYIDVGATGDLDFVINGLVKGDNPFADRGDGTGPYAVYNTLYEAVKQGLIEDDPTTTDWEGSKGMLNNGEIGCMVLGSWSVVQMQGAGSHSEDIGYMGFPISVNGKQYAASGPDYNYGINCNSSADNQIAAMCYIKWLVEESGFAQSEGGLSVVIGDKYPEALSELEDVEVVVGNAAPEGEENLFNDVNNESELGLTTGGNIAIEIVEEASAGSKTMEEMSAGWNERWTAAQEACGVK